MSHTPAKRTARPAELAFTVAAACALAAAGCLAPRGGGLHASSRAREADRRAAEAFVQATASFGEGYLLYLRARSLDAEQKPTEAGPLWRLAARRLRECLEKDSDSAPAARALAICSLRLEDHEEALRALQTLTRLLPQDPRARRALGWGYLHAGRSEDAIRELRAAVRLFPSADQDRTACLMELGALLRKLGRNDELLSVLEPEVKRGGADGRVHALLAETLSALGRSDDATSACRRWLDTRRSPSSAEDARCLSLLAKEYAAAGRTEEGLSVLREYARRAPDNWPAVEAVARLLEAAGRRKEAVAQARAFAGAHVDPSAFLFLAELFESEGDFDGAAGVFQEILLKRPRASQALRHFAASRLVEIADRCVDAGREAAAIAAYRAAVAEDALPAEALPRLRLRLAGALAAAGRHGEAADTLRPLLGAGQDADIHALYVRCLWEAGRHADAVLAAQQDLRRFADDAPAAVQFHRLLSFFYIRLGRAADGENELRLALRLKPGHPDANNDLGYLYAEQGRNLEEAVERIQVALAARPDDPAFLDSLGWAYYRIALRDDDLAKAHSAHELLRRAAKARGDGVILCHLGDVRFVLGMWRAAAEAWELSLKTGPDPAFEAERSLCKLKLEALRRRLTAGGPSAAPRPLIAPEKQLRVPSDSPPPSADGGCRPPGPGKPSHGALDSSGETAHPTGNSAM